MNIQQIINDKLTQIQNDGLIEKAISEHLEKSIIQGITSAIGGYEIKRCVEHKMQEQVTSSLSSVDFSLYNGFMIEQLNHIINNTVKDDLQQKIKTLFNDFLIKKHEQIKLSEIIEKYQEYLCQNLDEDKKYALDNGFIFKISHDDVHKWKNVTICEKNKELSKYSNEGYKFTLSNKTDCETKNAMWMLSLDINGDRIDSIRGLWHMSDFDAFMLNLFFNKTPIICDCDENDIDTSLGLDW